ncbi:MAG TPA: hypothetical protein VGI31_10265 [Streptosporangiaceae bacterium]
MNLLVAARLLAAAVLSAGPGAHPAPAHDVTYRSDLQAAAAPTLASTSPVLSQTGASTWRTTVLVSGYNGACPVAVSDYSLETIAPAPASTPAARIPATATRVAQGQPGPPTGSPPARANSCEVTLTFTSLRQVPASATLVIDGSSALSLTVSRSVTFFYYFGIPAIFGGGMAVALLLLALVFVEVYDGDNRQWPFARRLGRWRRPFMGTFWRHEVYASSAWSLNDSWATNIAAAGTVVTTGLGLISATDSLFPGVTLDRFLLLNALAAGIVTVAPLVLAVRYARWVRLHQGITDAASVLLPSETPPRVTLSGATAVLARVARVSSPAGEIIDLPAHTRIDLTSPTAALVPTGNGIPLAAGTSATLVTGTLATVPQGAEIRLASGDKLHLPAQTPAELAAAADVVPAHRIRVTPPGLGVLTLPAADPPPVVTLPADTAVTLAPSRAATLTTATPVALPRGGLATITPTATVPLEGLQIMLPDGTTAHLSAALADPPLEAGTQITTLYAEPATLHSDASLPLYQIKYGSAAEIAVPSGATITVPWGAVLTATPAGPPGYGLAGQLVQVPAGQAIQVPPDSTITVRAAGITLPTGPDVFVRGDSVLEISNAAGVLTVAAGSVAAAHGHPDNDVQLPLPGRMAAPGGAKITVSGVAEITLPAGTTVSAPNRPKFALTEARRRFRWPQGGNSLAGTVGMVILAAMVTTFGIGAELGVAAVLAVGLSDASTLGRVIAGAAVAAVGLFTLRYAVTAIRALADPQPGSSMSATAGTSFTL